MAGANRENGERVQQLKAFDATKAGVKGLVDAGVTKIPRIFVRPADELAQELTHKTSPQPQVVVIDLTDIESDPERRKRVVEEMRGAAETWGFFQVVNHGIPGKVVEEMINGIKEFNEMEVEEKRKYYTRDPTRRVRFVSNYDLFNSTTANWRDTLAISFADHEFHYQELPPTCRKSTFEYSKHVIILTKTLLELLSEALGLKSNYLNEMECTKGNHMSCHYYPACPEPELTLGATKHSDVGFITILLQNQLSGLQVLHHDQWVDVQPIRQGLVVNIGDLLQLVSNGKFISSKHRVVASSVGPRVSVANLFGPSSSSGFKRYGPITELISEENPPKYKEIVFGEYLHKFITTGLDQFLGLDYYKL